MLKKKAAASFRMLPLSLLYWLSGSELRLNPKLKHTLNEAADVVAKNLAESFIRLRYVALATDARAELSLDHVERGFNVRPLVIRSQERIAVERIEVKHLFKQTANLACRILLESNERRRAYTGDCFMVLSARISFVG